VYLAGGLLAPLQTLLSHRWRPPRSSPPEVGPVEGPSKARRRPVEGPSKARRRPAKGFSGAFPSLPPPLPSPSPQIEKRSPPGGGDASVICGGQAMPAGEGDASIASEHLKFYSGFPAVS